MKILHINASDVGSTGKIVVELCKESRLRNWECVSLFPRRNREPINEIKEYCTSRPLEQGLCRRLCYFYGLHYGCSPFSTGRILRILRKEKPDLVHLHSINCFMVNIYRLLDYLKKNQIPTVVTNHAEFFYTGNCPHAYDCEKWKTGCGNCHALFEASESKFLDRTRTAWNKMRKAFAGHRRISIVSVSPWVYQRSVSSPIMEGLAQRVILNGVNDRVFRYISAAQARNELGFCGNEKLILHVTANFSDAQNDLKNGRQLIALAKRFEGENIRFLVVGKHDAAVQIPSNITLVGEVRDQTRLAQYYAATDLTVVVSRRETFGMTVAEAMCCGTPVVGVSSGGSDSIALSQYTQFAPYGDVDTLEAAIRNKWLDYKNEDTAREISREALRAYSAGVMAKKYCDLYEEMINEDVST